MEKTKIKILPPAFIHNKLFDYIDNAAEKLIIYENVTLEKSIIIGVEKDDEIVSAVVLDIHSDKIHLRRTTGEFVKNRFALDVFITALGKFLNKQKISLTDTDMPKFMKKKMGFSHDGIEYVRAI